MVDNMIGKRFGKLTVLQREPDLICASGSKHAMYLCRCDCGAIKKVMKEHLKSGATKSCGCLRKNKPTEHGDIHTRLYGIWSNMLSRCSNPNVPAYKNYGERGISVCDAWKDYIQFKLWALSAGYDDSLTIDRIDNDGNYCPENCRWTDKIVQGNNKRNNRTETYNGITMTVAEWALKLGIPYKVLHTRLERGWSPERAFNQPVRKSPNK